MELVHINYVSINMEYRQFKRIFGKQAMIVSIIILENQFK